ncbi:hypothetical protein [Daejeonella sp.]|uniref:hypothetical protein n=1 Tax=Daejeonella sp. TaxID=2805397 RepID=UPI00398320AB
MNSVGTQNPLLYRLVAAHYLVAAICFVSLAVMLLFAAGNLTGHYFHPQLLAVTHMAALGWGTLIIFGAVYQLLPVILETELYSHKAGWISIGLFVSGLIALVYSFWAFQPGIHMQCGSVLLLAGISLFGANVFLTAKQNRNDIHQEFIITACIWLIVTALLGTMMVFNFRYAFLQQDHILFLKLHAHMGLVGWFLMLITGVSSKLIPMFLVSRNQKSQLLSWSYYLINGGLALFVVDTYFSGLNMKTYGAAAIALAGIACWLVFVADCFRSRMRKAIDLPIWHTLLSMLLLVTAIFVLPLIVSNHLRSDPRAVNYTTLYGSLLFMGWISALVLGQTFKTLPFIVWIRHYEHLAGKDPIPMPADLYNNGLLKMQFAVFLLFTMTFYAGMFFKSAILIDVGLGCFLIVALTYLFNVMIVLFHKPKSETT